MQKPRKYPISPRREPNVKQALKTLFQRAVKYHAAPDGITNEDVYNMLVKQEDQARLRFIEGELGELQIQGFSRNHNTIDSSITLPNGEITRFQMTLATPLVCLLPSYAGAGLLGDTDMPGEQREKIQAWVNTRFNVGVRFAVAWAAISALNSRLDTRQQMKFYCDGIVTLMDMSDELKDHADELRELMTMPKNLPSIPPELHREAIKATKTIGWARLFPAEDTAVQRKPVTLSMWDEQLGTILNPWGGPRIQVW